MIPCGGVQSCIYPARLGDETGICVGRGCGGLTDTVSLASACFGPLGVTARDAFLSGDCDGDLVPNGMDVGALCDGGAVVSLSLAGRVQWHAPERYDVAEGSTIAPADAFSAVTDAIGIGCTERRPCPVLPSAPALASRCVYLVNDPTIGDVGVCTYYIDDRDDRSCLATSFSGDGCLADSGGPNDRWEHGDCDGDGLINKLDPRVCAQLELMGQVSDGYALCAFGTVDTPLCPDGTVGEIASGQYGCATEPTATGAFAPFAYCCHGYEDCPATQDPMSASRARCVFLGTSPSGDDIGACTYVGTFVPDDHTCQAFSPPLGRTCMSGEVSYTSWANGNCDLGCDDHLNYADEVVCSVCPPGDAGVDADAWRDLDAWEGADAWAAPFDAAIDAGDADAASQDAPGLDAAAPPPSSFAGSGCRCSLAHRASSSPALGLLVLLGGLFAAGRRGLGRRRQR